MLKVNEIMESIQGEGLSIGRPTTFIRLTGCNLSCKWCDTKYAWGKNWLSGEPVVRTPGNVENVKFLPDQSVNMDVRDIVKMVKGFGCPHVDITGGEPLVQMGDDLDELVELLYATHHIISVETNGTFIPTPVMRDLVSGWAVSPKLPSSGNPIDIGSIKRLIDFLKIKMQFKFVISGEQDVVYLRDIMEYVGDIPCTLTPVWNGRDDTRADEFDMGICMRNLKELYNMTKDMFKGYNVRYLPQLHRLMEVK